MPVAIQKRSHRRKVATNFGKSKNRQKKVIETPPIDATGSENELSSKSTAANDQENHMEGNVKEFETIEESVRTTEIVSPIINNKGNDEIGTGIPKKCTRKEVLDFYDTNLKNQEDRLKGLLSAIETYESMEAKSLISQLKESYSRIMVDFPGLLEAKCGIVVEQTLWLNCFYRWLSLHKQRIQKYEAKQLSLKTIKTNVAYRSQVQRKARNLVSTFLQNLNNAGDFYQSLAHKLDVKLSDLSLAKRTKHTKGDTQLLKQYLFSCYIFLGDIARYKIPYEQKKTSNPAAKSACEKFYWEAVQLWPENGNSYNQLATLELNDKNLLKAAAYYVRAICCKIPFLPTSKKNLMVMFKNRILGDVEKCTFAYFVNKENVILMKKDLSSNNKLKSELRKLVIDNFMLFMGSFHSSSVGEMLPSFSLSFQVFKRAFLLLLQFNSFSREILNSFITILIYILELKKFDKQVVDFFIGLLAMMLSHFNELAVKSKSSEIPDISFANLSILSYVTLMTDFVTVLEPLNKKRMFSMLLQSNEFLKNLFENFDFLKTVAKKAPLSTDLARNCLREELDFRAFSCFEETYKKFVVNELMLEKHSVHVRAKKLATFCELLLVEAKTVREQNLFPIPFDVPTGIGLEEACQEKAVFLDDVKHLQPSFKDDSNLAISSENSIEKVDAASKKYKNQHYFKKLKKSKIDVTLMKSPTDHDSRLSLQKAFKRNETRTENFVEVDDETEEILLMQPKHLKSKKETLVTSSLILEKNARLQQPRNPALQSANVLGPIYDVPVDRSGNIFNDSSKFLDQTKPHVDDNMKEKFNADSIIADLDMMFDSTSIFDQENDVFGNYNYGYSNIFSEDHSFNNVQIGLSEKFPLEQATTGYNVTNLGSEFQSRNLFADEGSLMRTPVLQQTSTSLRHDINADNLFMGNHIQNFENSRLPAFLTQETISSNIGYPLQNVMRGSTNLGEEHDTHGNNTRINPPPGFGSINSR